MLYHSLTTRQAIPSSVYKHGLTDQPTNCLTTLLATYEANKSRLTYYEKYDNNRDRQLFYIIDAIVVICNNRKQDPKRL